MQPEEERNGETRPSYPILYIAFVVTIRSVDMWGLGCLIWEVYNGPLSQSMALKNTNNVSGNHYTL